MSRQAKPSTTTQRIHFTDLDPGRFEDLCLALVFPLHPWTDIQHYGRAGADGAVDIPLSANVSETATPAEFTVQGVGVVSRGIVDQQFGS